MKKLTQSLLVLSTLTSLNLFAGEGSACSSEALKALKLSDAQKTVECIEYDQKSDKKTYVAWIGSDDNGDSVAARYYVKNGKESYQLLFEQDELGEAFLPFEVDGKEKKLVIKDFNNDGVFDVAFRSYTVPATELYVQYFVSDSDQVRSIGFMDFAGTEPEFVAQMIFSSSAKVIVGKDSVVGKKGDKVETEYVLAGGHYIIKNL